jgi:hypothetical protein
MQVAVKGPKEKRKQDTTTSGRNEDKKRDDHRKNLSRETF